MTSTVQKMISSINKKDEEQLKINDKMFADFYHKLKGDLEAYDNILILGDYDCDGIVSSLILNRIVPEAKVVLGDRYKYGYGLPDVKDLPLSENTLVICTDVGCNEIEKLSQINQITNAPIYIIDHHNIGTDVVTSLMNNYPYLLDFYKQQNLEKGKVADYCATGLAYKLYELDYREKGKDDIKEFNTVTAYASIGTVGDMVKVNNPYDDNREIIRKGFEKINNANPNNFNGTLARFLNLCGIDGKNPINTHEVGFKISNVINALGRMEENGANKVYEALNSEIFTKNNEFVKETDEKLKYLINVNEQRKDLQKVYRESIEYKNALNNENKINILVSESLKQGLTGLVATELCNETGKATIVFTKDSKGNYVASGRSPENYPNMLENCKVDKVLKIGGHEKALGMTVEPKNIEFVKKALEDKYNSLEIPELKTEYLDIPEDFDISTMYALEPFGTDFPKPNFKAEVQIDKFNTKMLAGNENWKRVYLSNNIEAVTFNKGNMLNAGDKVIVKGEMDINTFAGKQCLQIAIKDIESKQKTIDKNNIELEK